MAALATGLALPVIETWRRWRELSEWTFWLDDYLAAALLLYAWYAGRARMASSRPYLMAAWGYVFGMAYASLVGQLKHFAAVTDPSGVPLKWVLAFKGFGLALSVVCLALAWSARESRESMARRQDSL